MKAKNDITFKKRVAKDNKIICSFFLILLVLFPVAAYSLDDQTVEVIVTQGDYLINICKQYLAQPQQCSQVIKTNKLKEPDLIYPGQKIKIPVVLLKGTPADGVVIFVKGDVTVKRKEGDEWAPVQMHDAVSEGSGVKTGQESAVEIAFEDETSMFLKADTRMDLSVSRKSPLHLMRELFLRAGRSVIKFRGATGQEKRFNIRTPSAVATARGTKFRTSVDRDEATRAEVLEGNVEVEAMKQKVYVSEGEGTLVINGKPPMMPRKLLPPPALVNMETLYKSFPVRFQFAKVEGASSYRIALSRDKEMKEVLKEAVINPEAFFDISGIEDGVYYLQSTSFDGDGIEGFPLEPVLIKVRVNPLPPFTNSPVNDSEHRQKNIAFHWLKVADAAGYHLQIAEDSEFNSNIADRNIKGTEYSASLDYKTYFFRLSSIAADGYEGVWSDVQRFTILTPPPAPPLDKPSMERDTVTIGWQNLGNNITYHFQMAADPDFSTILIDKNMETPRIVLQKPDKAGTYYVRISSIDADKYEGSFSQPQSFEIKRRFRYEILGVLGAAGFILLLGL